MTATIADFLLPYSVQLALVLGVGLLAPVMMRLRGAQWQLRYHYGLLMLGALLPCGLMLSGATPLSSPMPLAGGLRLEPLTLTVTAVRGELALPSLVAALWLGGVAVRAALLGLGALALHRYRLAAAPVPWDAIAPKPALASVARPIKVLCSERLSVPITYGLRRPVVLLPRSFYSLPQGGRAAVLCHELLHVQRRDWLVVLLEELVRCVLWFHPLIWLLLDRISLLREKVVDREVVARTGARSTYLDTLVAVAESAAHPASVPAPLFVGAKHLKHRVSELLQEVSVTTKRTLATMTPTILCALLATALAATLFPWKSHQAFAAVSAEQESAAQADESQGKEPLYVTGDVTPPQKISAPAPEYTEEARKAKIEGEVVVRTVINEQGDVVGTTVLKEQPMGLTEAAVAAIKTWKFEPAKLDGEPVTVQYNLTINFRLE